MRKPSNAEYIPSEEMAVSHFKLSQDAAEKIHKLAKYLVDTGMAQWTDVDVPDGAPFFALAFPKELWIWDKDSSVPLRLKNGK